jgi:hypothetical protein
LAVLDWDHAVGRHDRRLLGDLLFLIEAGAARPMRLIGSGVLDTGQTTKRIHSLLLTSKHICI